jgi:integrase
VAKKKRPREIWLHPRIRQDLKEWRRGFPMAQHLALGENEQPRSTNALTVWFHRTYEQMGLPDCSSHSGRRSLITYLANNCGRENMSLRDVQIIAGHASIATTEAYVQPSANPGLLIKSVPWRPRDFEQLPVGLAQRSQTVPPAAIEEPSAFRWAAEPASTPPRSRLIFAGDEA